VLDPGQAVVAGDVGERVDGGMVFGEPVAEPAECEFQLLHRGRPIR